MDTWRHWLGRAAALDIVLGSPGCVGLRETWRLSQASRMPRALTIHWAPCQSWLSEAVRSKVKGKVNPVPLLESSVHQDGFSCE